jgi:methyltransferase (TIGR00027 family)
MASKSEIALSEVHRTAFLAAALRAWHELAGAEPKIFRDPFALPLSEMSIEEVMAVGSRAPPGSASTCVLRSRFAEDRLATARARLDQYVVLGAGLDSYALRMGDQLGALTVFEVDDPPLQAWKRLRIEALGLNAPKQLRYVPCDFERTSISQALAAHEFDGAEPCFISWLGVTQYLTLEAINQTLRWAHDRPAGSEIVLTFVEPGAQDRRADGSRPSIVDFTSFITSSEMLAMLQEVGFSRISLLAPETAHDIYFKQREDGLVAPKHQRIVSAIVGD